MTPYHHAVSSVKKWGGTPADYLPGFDSILLSLYKLVGLTRRAVLCKIVHEWLKVRGLVHTQ